jgi:phosphoribosylformylglycinamidine synthase II
VPIHSIFVNRADDPEAVTLLARLRAQGHTRLEGLTIERVYRLEGDVDPQSLTPLFVNSVFESGTPETVLDPAAGPIVEIGYQRAVTDPETPSILEGARALGVNALEWARLAHRYQFLGIDEAEAHQIAEEVLYNPVVQEIVPADRVWDSLRPTGTPEPVRRISLAGMSEAELQRASEENSWYAPTCQMRALQKYEAERGRPFTDAEVEIVVQSWSDHCYHTTWKSLGLFQKLMDATRRIDHPLVVSVFKDNAGGMLLTDDWVITIKGETHNFPSSIATFGGVATKHGGVIRDTLGFGKGAMPIGGSTVMGTMDPRLPEADVPAGALHPGHIVRESIRATAYYCNPMGIPMMYPVYRSHPGYPKCLALGHSLGLIPREYAMKERPQPGDAVLLLGGRTGRDGLHGATASSAQMTGETAEKEAAAVQIGHPIIERNFMEAIPHLRDTGCLRTITDLGAGGISCAAGEMGEHTGVRVELDRVPLKDQSLTAWEILLSESQERMLAAVPPEKLDVALEILRRFDVEATVIGQFTDTKRYEAFWCGEEVVNLEMHFLWRCCPIEPAEVRPPARLPGQASEARVSRSAPQEVTPSSLSEVLEAGKAVLAHYHCCDQSAAGFQFDSMVQGRTVVGPYAGVTSRMPTHAFVSAPVRGENIGAVSTIAYNPFYGELDPAGMARLMMVEALSRAVAVGADPEAITLCDNFYTPKATPEWNWALVQMVDTIADLSVRLGTPFISGKDSSSGTFRSSDGRSIDVPLTFAVATMGRVPDVARIVTKPLKRAGNHLVLLGRFDPERLGGSVYLDCQGKRAGTLHDFGQEWAAGLKETWARLHALTLREENPVQAAAAIGEGGLFARLFEMAYGGGLGAVLDLDSLGQGPLEGRLFAEAIGSFLLEVDAGTDPALLLEGLEYRVIGNVAPDPGIEIRAGGNTARVSLAELEEVWSAPFREVVG